MRQRAAYTHGVTVVQVVRVRQWARRGTEAEVYDLHANRYQGAWFWWTRVEPGQVLAVAGGTGYGPMRNEDPVLYVPANGIYDVLPADVASRALRYHREHPGAPTQH
jgi:hypothetical protein